MSSAFIYVGAGAPLITVHFIKFTPKRVVE